MDILENCGGEVHIMFAILSSPSPRSGICLYAFLYGGQLHLAQDFGYFGVVIQVAGLAEDAVVG